MIKTIGELGVVAANSTDYSVACDGTNDKGCQIIVPASSTEIKSGTLNDRILKQSAVTIVAAEGDVDDAFYVVFSTSTGLTSVRNRD